MPYGTGFTPSWSIQSTPVNSTVCVDNYVVGGCYWGSYGDFTAFFNNNSFITSTMYRSFYCHVRTPPGRDDVNCFYSGASCSGRSPVDLHSDLNNGILSKFNFVNHSDSDGYFFFVYSNIKTKIKDSVILFTSTSPKWVYSAELNAALEIEDSFIIASGDLASHAQITTFNAHRTTCASTYGRFRRHPVYKECGPVSRRFSHLNPPLVLYQYILITLSVPIISK